MKSFAFSAIVLAGTVAATAMPSGGSDAAAFCQSGYDTCQKNPPNEFYCENDYTRCCAANGIQPSPHSSSSASPTSSVVSKSSTSSGFHTTTSSSSSSIPHAGTPWVGPSAYPVGPTAYPNVTTTTWVTDRVTVPCAGPTTVVQGGKTYTVTAATTLTITDCPCTVSGTKATPVPVPQGASGGSPPKQQGTAPVASGYAAPSGTGSYGSQGGSGGNSTVQSPSSPSGPLQQVGNSAAKVGGAGLALGGAVFAGMAFLL